MSVASTITSYFAFLIITTRMQAHDPGVYCGLKTKYRRKKIIILRCCSRIIYVTCYLPYLVRLNYFSLILRYLLRLSAFFHSLPAAYSLLYPSQLPNRKDRQSALPFCPYLLQLVLKPFF